VENVAAMVEPILSFFLFLLHHKIMENVAVEINETTNFSDSPEKKKLKLLLATEK